MMKAAQMVLLLSLMVAALATTGCQNTNGSREGGGGLVRLLSVALVWLRNDLDGIDFTTPECKNTTNEGNGKNENFTEINHRVCWDRFAFGSGL